MHSVQSVQLPSRAASAARPLAVSAPLATCSENPAKHMSRHRPRFARLLLSEPGRAELEEQIVQRSRSSTTGGICHASWFAGKMRRAERIKNKLSPSIPQASSLNATRQANTMQAAFLSMRSPNPSVERTRHGMSRMAVISFWAMRAMPQRAAHLQR